MNDIGTRAGCKRDNLEEKNINKAVLEVKVEELLNEIWDYKVQRSATDVVLFSNLIFFFHISV